MNNTTPIILAAAAALAIAIATLGGCDDALIFDCTYDSDCFGDEYCINNQCTPECDRDDECSPSRYCGAYQRQSESDPLQVCLDPDDEETGCSTDEECRDRLDDQSARCGIHNSCVLTPPEAGNSDEASENDAANGANDDNDADVESTNSLLVVEQLDSDGEVVDSDTELTETPGIASVRIGAVVVRNAEESAVGFGETVDVDIAVEPDTSPALSYPVDEEGTCIDDPDSAAYTPLGGPGGQAFIELLDDPGVPLVPGDGWSIQIVADGPYCPLGGINYDDADQGTYRALLCSTDALAFGFDEGQHCRQIFDGPHSSFAELEVTESD